MLAKQELDALNEQLAEQADLLQRMIDPAEQATLRMIESLGEIEARLKND